MHLRTLSDRALLCAVVALVVRDRLTTAKLLEHLAEIDARRLYLGQGHGSMFAYCTDGLRMSESEAARRVHAARAIRRFPALLAAVRDGRLHLSALCLLAPHLTPENLAELVSAATHRKKSEVEAWLGARFAPPIVIAAAATSRGGAGSVGAPATTAGPVVAPSPALGPPLDTTPGEHLLGDVGVASTAVPPGPAIVPHIVLHLALPPATHAKLRRAQALLAHALPAGDSTAAVFDRALDTLLEQVERHKFAAAKKPRARRAEPGPRRAPRTIPAAVKRAVVARDGERCAYVAPGGRRCSARSRLEFDHLDPVARGGLASADRVRLLCRAHNQFEAERAFGREFMQARRRQAALAREARALETAPASPDPPG